MSVGQHVRSIVAPLGNLAGFIFPLGCIALLIVPGIWFYQAREWMNSGQWPAISVADGLEWAGIALPQSSLAASAVTDSFLRFPLSLTLLVLIGGPLFAYARLSQWLEKTCEPDITPLN